MCYWNAFLQLSQSRITIQGYPQPIALNEIWAYCSLFDIAKSDIQDYIIYITALDSEFLKYCNKRIEASQERQSSRSAGPRTRGK